MEKNGTKKKNKKLLLALLLLLGAGGVAAGVAVPLTMKHNSQAKQITLAEIKVEYQRVLDETSKQTIKDETAAKLAPADVLKAAGLQEKPEAWSVASTKGDLQTSSSIQLDSFTQETDITVINSHLEIIAAHNAAVEAWNAAVERLSAPAQPTTTQPTNTPVVVKTLAEKAEDAWALAQSKVATFKMMHEATYDATAGIDASTLTKTIVREQLTYGSTDVDFLWKDEDYKPMMFTPSEITALKAWFDKVPSTTSFASNWSTYAQLFPATGDRLALHAMLDGFAEDHINIIVNPTNAVWESTTMTPWDATWGAHAPNNFLTDNISTPSNFYLVSRALAPVPAESYHYVMDKIIAPIVNADLTDHHKIDIIKATPADFAKITTSIQARSMTASNKMGQRYDVNTVIKSSTQTIDTMYQIEADHTPAFMTEEDLHQWFLKDWMAKNPNA